MQGGSGAPSPATSSDCLVHDHPVPPEEVGKYSPVRDGDSEQDIANYVHSQARDETVRHAEKIKTEYVCGTAHDIWDVTTDKSRWWVITNWTNLYSQKHFPSLDYTLSFHIGLMMRLRSRPQGPDAASPHPFDEVYRRQQQAKERFERAIEGVDYQAVGMQLRECLISLIGAMRRRIEIADLTERPQDSNFIAWIELLMNQLCRGPHHKDLRGYLKATSEKTWQLVNWLTHARNADQTAAAIAIEACDTLIGHAAELLSRDKTENIETCPCCLSRNLRSHFDIGIEPDGGYYSTCGQCDWSSHPNQASA
ncbi:MAG: gamma-glutamylcyclotransferase [Proteobacteria bacterium]|nr:gamma-glutamylcyclotransferase [Pseudomonadota bacterium]